MTKRDLILKIVKDMGLNEIAVSEFADSVFTSLESAFKKGKNTNILKFGRFTVTDKTIEGEKQKAISFSPVKKFADEVNYNYENLEPVKIRVLDEARIQKSISEGKETNENIDDFVVFDFADEGYTEDILQEPVTEQVRERVTKQVKGQDEGQAEEQLKEQTVEQVKERTVEQAKERTVEQVKERTVEQVKERTVEQVKEQTVEQVKEQTVEQVKEQITGDTIPEPEVQTEHHRIKESLKTSTLYLAETTAYDIPEPAKGEKQNIFPQTEIISDAGAGTTEENHDVLSEIYTDDKLITGTQGTQNVFSDIDDKTIPEAHDTQNVFSDINDKLIPVTQETQNIFEVPDEEIPFESHGIQNVFEDLTREEAESRVEENDISYKTEIDEPERKDDDSQLNQVLEERQRILREIQKLESDYFDDGDTDLDDTNISGKISQEKDTGNYVPPVISDFSDIKEGGIIFSEKKKDSITDHPHFPQDKKEDGLDLKEPSGIIDQEEKQATSGTDKPEDISGTDVFGTRNDSKFAESKSPDDFDDWFRELENLAAKSKYQIPDTKIPDFESGKISVPEEKSITEPKIFPDSKPTGAGSIKNPELQIFERLSDSQILISMPEFPGLSSKLDKYLDDIAGIKEVNVIEELSLAEPPARLEDAFSVKSKGDGSITPSQILSPPSKVKNYGDIFTPMEHVQKFGTFPPGITTAPKNDRKRFIKILTYLVIGIILLVIIITVYNNFFKSQGGPAIRDTVVTKRSDSNKEKIDSLNYPGHYTVGEKPINVFQDQETIFWKTSGGFTIQFGAFNTIEPAQLMVERLRNKDVPAMVVRFINEENILSYRVVAGPYKTLEDAIEEYSR